ncbi:hypothetical protein [Erwinia sp. MYb416]|uniref:hypothetical protein n=1 Tax=Erwinia sp. MYb416 TaxID=3108532 RepID=UPI003097112C
MSNDDHKPDGRLPFGYSPDSLKNINITIYGLEQWKDGIVSGAEVRIDILQKGKCIHSEVFSGKASALKVSAEFSDAVLVERGQVFIKQAFIKDGIADAESKLSEKMRKLIDDAVSEGIRNSLRPGGLLHGR